MPNYSALFKTFIYLLLAFTTQASSAQGIAIRADSTSEQHASNRAAQYDALAKDVAALEQQLGIFKRVVKLTAPTVVHIEAEPVVGYQGRQDIQEAGSGVIAKLNNRMVILTNRHVIKNSDKDMKNPMTALAIIGYFLVLISRAQF